MNSGIGSISIALWALRKSSEANRIAQKANEIALAANTFEKEKYKKKVIKEIIDYLIENWSKGPGVEAHIIVQWEMHKLNGLTVKDFNDILDSCYLKVKRRKPKKSFEELLRSQNEKKS